MKSIQVPLYVYDAVLRHYERIATHGKQGARDTKTTEAFRLALQDIKKLKRLKQQQT